MGITKRKKSAKQKCKEGIEHTWLFDFSTEDSQTWKRMFCGTVVKFNKEQGV